MSKIFSDEELRELEKSLPDQALDALNAGDKGKVSHLLLQMLGAHTALHFLGVASITRIWGKWHHDLGENKAREMIERAGRLAAAPFIKLFLEGEEKEAITDIIDVYKHHAGGQIFPHSQADDELVFDLAPCGSGGINVLKNFEKTMPQWYTRFEDDTPIFCVGCKALQKAMNEAVGEEVWTTEINSKMPGSCRMRFRQKETRGKPLFAAHELYALTKTRTQQALDQVSVGRFKIEKLIEGQQHDWAGMIC